MTAFLPFALAGTGGRGEMFVVSAHVLSIIRSVFCNVLIRLSFLF